MFRIALIAALASVTASPVLADMPKRLGCIADDVYFVWYGQGLGTGMAASGSSDPNQKVAGVRATDPQSRMRFEDMRLYLSDATRTEYFYAPVEAIAADEYRSSRYTLLFDPQYRTLVAVNVSAVSTSVTSFKCVQG
jgi:hypothetical protein